MTQIIDRRLNGKNKNAVNRQRFLQRYKQQIKRAISDAVARRSITNIEHGEKIIIPAKDLSEPMFGHGIGGRHEIVHTGNQDFMTGDRIKRSPDSSKNGQGEQTDSHNEGEDEFGFEISREEFLDLFFEDLALPNLVKRQLVETPTYVSIRAGFKRYGTPSSINIARSMRNAVARRIALISPYKKQLTIFKQILETIQKNDLNKNSEEAEIINRIYQLKKKIARVPFIDTYDLRFNNFNVQPKPTTQAVMFCLMDVSGSMDETRKELAKKFFIILYLFLTKNYEKIELVFIRHHTVATEVDEQSFFHSRETGGTVVSSALELMKEIINTRYSSDLWNIYAAQASDGDNWNNDSPRCSEILVNYIMPCVQYFAYIEVMPQTHQSLWEVYLLVKQKYGNFAMKTVNAKDEIFPVFQELFSREKTH